MFKIGAVISYFEKIGVAIVKLDSPLSIGEKIKFIFDGTELFTQVVNSIQIGHKKVDFADRGQTVGLKVSEPVKTGYEIFKM